MNKPMLFFGFRAALVAVTFFCISCSDDEDSAASLQVTPAGDVLFSALRPETYRFGVITNTTWEIQIAGPEPTG